ncbi:hypothetical protein PVL29_007834 [Vitis rotundifolia]|uniref:Uncharacterized protein n=1 Tax=Vitis rotundifolia TaxID=103349 RepID=A0AA39A1X6_VITRO|nr:hypothetical protein PVL29_007834 [Vitis rotundifolia]
MGFGGLLQLGCKELRYDLIMWIIANYDIGYHQLCMWTNVVVLVTPKDVKKVIGIPDNGVDIVVYNRCGIPNRTYNIQILEDNMRNLLLGDVFKKSFLIFACATILVPNSKLEGMHDLWDTIWDSDMVVDKNWRKFVLQFVEDGIRDYHNNHPTYIRSCMLFLQAPLTHLYLFPIARFFYITKFYMSSVQVEVQNNQLHIWIHLHTKQHVHIPMSPPRYPTAL